MPAARLHGETPVLLAEKVFQDFEHRFGRDFGEAMGGAAADEGAPDAFAIFGEQQAMLGADGIPTLFQAGSEDGDGFDVEGSGEVHGAGVVRDHGAGGLDGGEQAGQIEFGENAYFRNEFLQIIEKLFFDRRDAVGKHQIVPAGGGELMEARPVGGRPLLFGRSGAGVANDERFRGSAGEGTCDGRIGVQFDFDFLRRRNIPRRKDVE